MNEKEFMKALAELKDLALLQGGFVSEVQMEECIPGLQAKQKPLVLEYLKQAGIGINEPLQRNEDISEEEKDHLHFYLEELEDLEKTEDSMKQLLLREALTGDRMAKDRLIESYLHSVVDIARLYAGQGADMADLIGEGNVALAAAVENLECVETPEDADAMIAKMIMNAMEAFVGIENDEEQLMEQVFTDTAKVLDKARQMAEELLRKVTIEELSKESGITEEEILQAARIAKECADYIELPRND